MKLRVCKDCKAGGRPLTRPAPHPGPRCATDHRAFRKAQKEAAHDKRAQQVYGLAPGEYRRLYEAQGGRCAILNCRATGTGRRKLAVDHDHGTGKVRGLLCSTHNQMIGHAGDDPEVFRSIASYLEHPPADVRDPECTHEAYEEYGDRRICADCKERLE